MRLIHTSDWHLGRTLHGADLLRIRRRFSTGCSPTSISHEVDAVVVAGDIYDRAVPPIDAVAVLDQALRGFAAARIPVLLTSGNHDSAVRLGFGCEPRASWPACTSAPTSPTSPGRSCSPTATGRGRRLRHPVPAARRRRWPSSTRIARTRRCWPPRLALIRADAAERGIGRTVVAAHAFVTGALTCDSERDIRVGGIGDVAGVGFRRSDLRRARPSARPAECSSVLDGGTRRQVQRLAARVLLLRTSSAPSRSRWLRSTRAGAVTTTLLPPPVPRPLRQVRGKLEDLLAADDRRSGRRLGQGRADRHRPPGVADGAAAGALAAHARARFRARGRAGDGRRPICGGSRGPPTRPRSAPCSSSSPAAASPTPSSGLCSPTSSRPSRPRGRLGRRRRHEGRTRRSEWEDAEAAA